MLKNYHISFLFSINNAIIPELSWALCQTYFVILVIQRYLSQYTQFYGKAQTLRIWSFLPTYYLETIIVSSFLPVVLLLPDSGESYQNLQ